MAVGFHSLAPSRWLSPISQTTRRYYATSCSNADCSVSQAPDRSDCESRTAYLRARLLPACASTVGLGSEPHGTKDHSLPSDDSGGLQTPNSSVFPYSQTKVIIRSTVSRLVCIVVKSDLVLMSRFLLLSHNCGFVYVGGGLLLREGESVVYSSCWFSLVHSRVQIPRDLYFTISDSRLSQP